MANVNFFIGKAVNFNNICFVYPPTINEMIGDDFFSLSQFFIISQEDIEDEYTKNEQSLEEMPTPFEQLLSLAYNVPQMKEKVEKAFFQFTHEQITFFFNLKKIAFGSKEKIIKECKTLEDVRFLTEENYFDFQNLIRESIGLKPSEPYDKDEDPRIKRIKAKARYRDRIKAKKGMGISLCDSISSICCMGIGLNPLNIGELTYVAARELIARYTDKEKFNIDLHTIWAGADQKKHKITPKHWIRKLDDK